ncbi:MAG: glutamate 5-kinase [Fidelibacterota bacterium]|nr:MAG: glutamate 5-kinase [Candidatus Neomarinimicrobiota bacterium]
MRNALASPKKKRIIVKIGSHVLSESGRFTHEAVQRLADQLIEVTVAGNEVLLITSGAILMGRNIMGLDLDLYPQNLRQSLAAVGQVSLIHEYQNIFDRLEQPIGQILLNLEDFNNRRRYLSLKETILGLFKLKVLPILNENDCIHTEDFSFGDNDNLAAQVAGMLDADLLLILSTVDGLYDGDPRHPDSRVLPTVETITPRMLEDALSKGQLLSTGGMAAKLQAIDKALHFGVPVVLANGEAPDILRRLFAGEEIGTLFLPETKRMPLKKRWLAYSTKVKGQVVVDDGAYRAIMERNASLLSKGVVDSQGDFEAQDVVAIVNARGQEFARGITHYGCEDLKKIAGLSSSEIEKTLGVKYFDEVVHREELVLLPTRTRKET